MAPLFTCKIGVDCISLLQCYETLVDSESFPATLVTGSRWRNLQNILGEVYHLIMERQQNIVGYGI